MPPKTRRRPDWLCLAICVLMVILRVLSTVVHMQAYDYRFPVRTPGFYTWTIPCQIIPLIPAVLCAFFAFSKKVKHPRALSVILLVLFLILQIFWFLLSLKEIMMRPTVVSLTSDAANFGQYDKSIADSCPIPGFLQEIPPDAKDVQYSYFYANLSSEAVYVAVSWRYDDEEAFAQAVADYPTDDMEQIASGTELVWHRVRESIITSYYFTTAGIFDDATNRVYFVLTTWQDDLPTSSAEVDFDYGRILESGERIG